jgi:hypothetical protein
MFEAFAGVYLFAMFLYVAVELIDRYAGDE